METSTLAEILGVEQQIRVHLDAERERASRWLEDARREMDRTHEADLARLHADAEQRRGALLEAARAQASAIVHDAETAARAQARAGDEELGAFVRGHIAVIVPEGAR